MTHTNSAKPAFSVMELVFVIVILGILAAVAIPKLSGLQNDALIASEKAGIGAIKSSIASLHGKMIINGGDITTQVNLSDGTAKTVSVSATSAKYPQGLSIDGNATTTNSVENSADSTLAIVLDVGSREQWKTKAISGNIISLVGPATSSISDSTSELSTSDHWEYNNLTGTLVLKKNSAY